MYIYTHTHSFSLSLFLSLSFSLPLNTHKRAEWSEHSLRCGIHDDDTTIISQLQIQIRRPFAVACPPVQVQIIVPTHTHL